MTSIAPAANQTGADGLSVFTQCLIPTQTLPLKIHVWLTVNVTYQIKAR